MDSQTAVDISMPRIHNAIELLNGVEEIKEPLLRLFEGKMEVRHNTHAAITWLVHTGSRWSLTADLRRPLSCSLLQSRIECTSVPFARSRIEPFVDLALDVKGLDSIMRAFAEYTAEESLTDGNRYVAVDRARGLDFGKQDARKCLRFLRFPPILQLQLKRRQLDYATMTMKPVNDRFEFSTVLDLSEFECGENNQQEDDAAAISTRVRLPVDPLDPPIYHLHSVLVQTRSAGTGLRRSTFVRPFLALLQRRASNLPAPLSAVDLASLSAEYERSPFFHFEEDSVSLCDDNRAAVEMSFGGLPTELVQQLGKRMAVSSPSNGPAHMLVYVRRSMVARAGSLPHMQEASAVAHDSAPLVGLGSTAAAAASAMSDGPAQAQWDWEEDESKHSEAVATATAPSPPRFTDDPTDLRLFVESLTPAVVPMRAAVSASVRSYVVLQDELKAESLKCAVDVLCEWNLVWHSLRDADAASVRPTGGVAGCGWGLTVTSAEDPLFQLKQPSRRVSVLKASTIEQLRTMLAIESGITTKRLQIWLAAGPQPTLLSDLNRTIASLRSPDGRPTPLFVRDTQWIDARDGLTALPALASGAGERRLLLFKFFDVVAQRLCYIGSAAVVASSTMADVHQLAAAMMKLKEGVVTDHAVAGPPPTLVASFAEMAAEPARKRIDSDDPMRDADATTAVDALRAAGFAFSLQSLSAAPSSQTGPRSAAIGASRTDAGSLDYSSDELRWHDWKQQHPARAAVVCSDASIHSACLCGSPAPVAWPLCLEAEATDSSALVPVPNDPLQLVSALAGRSIILSHSVSIAHMAQARDQHRQRLTAWLAGVAAGQRPASIDIPRAVFHASAQSFVRSLHECPFEPPTCLSELPTAPRCLLRVANDALQSILAARTQQRDAHLSHDAQRHSHDQPCRCADQHRWHGRATRLPVGHSAESAPRRQAHHHAAHGATRNGAHRDGSARSARSHQHHRSMQCDPSVIEAALAEPGVCGRWLPRR